MSHRRIIDRPQHFHSLIQSLIDFLFIDLISCMGTHLKPHQIEDKETDFFYINIMIQALFIHDLLPGRHSALVGCSSQQRHRLS